jgi:8-oxo-dGTP pyrophosphatase MutT (NUDIX family)
LAAHLADATMAQRFAHRRFTRDEVLAHRAAVLVLLSDGADPDILLTERSPTLRHHGGQVSFPGGGIEAGESPVEAALREAAEEVGLEAAGVSVMGELPPAQIEVSRFAVRIVMAWWDGRGRVTVQDPAEVATIVRAPVSRLVDPAARLTWVHPRGHTGPGFEYDELFVWGFTAFVLDAVLRAGGWERPWPTDRRVLVPERFLPDTRSR